MSTIDPRSWYVRGGATARASGSVALRDSRRIRGLGRLTSASMLPQHVDPPTRPLLDHIDV